MYIRFTYVDSQTGIPVTSEASRNGPKNPDIPGLHFAFALESQYPTERPIFFGTCNDGVPATTQGILAVLTEAEFVLARTQEMAARVEKARAAKLELIKQLRKDCELKGVAFSGTLGDVPIPGTLYIPAEKDDQDRINSVLTNMERYPEIDHCQFKAGNNVFITLSYDMLKKIGFQVAKHVQECFRVESIHTINLSQLKTVDAIEAYNHKSGWPNS